MISTENIFILLIVIIGFWYLNNKTNNLEKMTETTAQTIVSTENLLAIKNLGELAAQLKKGGDITIPGNLTIAGDLKFKSENKKSKLIRNDGDKLVLTTSNGVNQEDWGWDKMMNLHDTGAQTINGDINVKAGHSIKSNGRLHISAEDRLYLLPKQGTWLTTDWGANGEITVTKLKTTDDIITNGKITINRPFNADILYMNTDNRPASLLVDGNGRPYFRSKSLNAGDGSGIQVWK